MFSELYSTEVIAERLERIKNSAEPRDYKIKLNDEPPFDYEEFVRRLKEKNWNLA